MHVNVHQIDSIVWLHRRIVQIERGRGRGSEKEGERVRMSSMGRKKERHLHVCLHK